MKLNNLVRWCLAFLCFGMLGVKVANAQSLGSSCQGSAYAANFALILNGANASGVIAPSDGMGGAGESWGGGSNFQIAHTLDFTSWDYGSGVFSVLPTSANASDYLSFGIWNNGLALPAGYSYTINSITASATTPFDLYYGSTQITSGAALSGAQYTNITNTAAIFASNAPIQIRPFNPNGTTTDWTLNSINVNITAVQNGQQMDACTGLPIPEPSSTALMLLAACGAVGTRRRTK